MVSFLIWKKFRPAKYNPINNLDSAKNSIDNTELSNNEKETYVTPHRHKEKGLGEWVVMIGGGIIAISILSLIFSNPREPSNADVSILVYMPIGFLIVFVGTFIISRKSKK
jgi:hypothetical protein